jgi:hypothetical protein
MQARQNRYLMPLLSILAVATLITALMSSSKLSDAVTNHAVNLSQLQTTQAQAKLAALKVIVDEQEATAVLGRSFIGADYQNAAH